MKITKLLLLAILFISTQFDARSANYFWIGGSGNWSDANHWSATSGGGTVGSIPTAADNVIFDAASGLAGQTVNMDVAVSVVNFNFSAAPAFTLSGALASITISGDLLSNATATVSYSGVINLFSGANTSSLTSNGRTWNNNFVLTSTTNNNGVSLTDAFVTTGTFSVTRGKFLTAGFAFTAQQFLSVTGQNRTINLTNSAVNITGTLWRLETGSTFTSTGSTISLSNSGAVTFFGGGETYNTVNSSATTLRIERANTFGAVTLLNSSYLLLDSVTQTMNSLTFNGTCSSNGFIGPIFPASPTPQIDINTAFNGSYLVVTRVDAVPPTVYTLTNSNTNNATGWTLSNTGVNYYWIGNSGNWNDGSHWSLSSGGVAANCIPNSSDSVFFDSNSFSLSDQTVTVNTEGYFKAMTWTGITTPQTMLLDSVNVINQGNLYAYGDVTLHNNLKVRRAENGCAIEFVNKSVLTANNADFDGNIRINLPVADSLLIQGALLMSDTSSVIFMKGILNTNSQVLRTGSFTTLNDPAGTADTRILRLGSTQAHFIQTFSAINDPQFTLNAGTSNIYIGDTLQIVPDTISYLNGLTTNGSGTLTFHNVTLNFIPIEYAAGVFASQKVTGNHVFNQLRILHGSRVEFGNASTQTVNDTLFMIGYCTDSIFVLSDGGGQFNISKTDNKVKIQCSTIEDMNIGTTAQTAYFSLNAGNNTGLTFDASSPISATFTSSSPDCFGDLTNLSPVATTQFSEPVTYLWQFNDGSTMDSLQDQYTGYSIDTLTFPSTVGTSVTDTLQIAQWTEQVDPANLFYPALNNGTGYPSSDVTSMRFDFDASFKLSLENGTGSNVYLTDMDSSFYKVKYNYRPKLNIVKNGALYTSVFLTTSAFEFKEDTLGGIDYLAPGSNQLADTTVNVSVILNNLQPTDNLTFYTSVQVTNSGYPQLPRWKDTQLNTGNDVAVGYKMVYDTLFFTASPFSNNLTGNSHIFNDRGDFQVSLIALNTINMCTDTIMDTVNIYGPISYLNTSQLDTTICAGEPVLFTASTSGDSTTLFTFFLNGTPVLGPGLSDSLYIDTLAHLDTVSILTTNGGCNSVNDPYYQFVVNDLPTYTLTVDPNDTICAGDLVTFTASGTGVKYRYKKNSNFVTSYSTNGVYSTSTLVNNDTISVLIKSDLTNCVADSVIPITVNPLPIISMTESTTDFLICQNEPVTFTASGAGVGGQYELFINGVSSGLLATATIVVDTLQNGDVVTLQGYNANGCKAFAPETFTYTVISLPSTAISINPGVTFCSGVPVTITATGATQYQFVIDGVPGTLSTTNSISSSSYADGTEIYVIGNSNNCTKNSDTLILNVIASPTTALSSSDPDNTFCAGTTVTFTGSGATNYQYFVNGTPQGPSSPTATFTSSTLSNGNVVMVTGESNGCLVSQSFTMTVLANPNVLLFSGDADNTVCEGESITFTGANAASYVLTVNGVPGASQASPSFPQVLPVGSNTLYVTGIAANGCTGTSPTISATVNPIPVMNLTSSDADNIICAGSPVTFTGSGSNQYQFFVNTTAQGSMSATNTFTTSALTNGQTVTVVGSSLGCTSTSSGITFTVNPVPPVTLISNDANNQFCQGDAVTFTSAGADAYQFFVNGTSQGAPSAVTTLDGSLLAPGSYPVSVTGTTNGCSSTSLLNVIVNANPTPSLSSNDTDNTICAGQAVTYTATGGNTYQFTVNGAPQGSPSPLGSFNTSALVNGDVVGVIATSAQTCSTPTSMGAITVNPNPTVSLTSSDADQQICIGDNVVFTATGATDYEFFVNGVSQGLPSATNTFNTSGLTNGQSVQVAGTSLGCTSNATPLSFLVFGPPAIQLFNNASLELCAGDAVNLTANGASNYQFTVNGTPAGPFSASPNFTNPVNNGDVVSVIGESNGCTNTSSTSYTFTVYNYPTLSSSSSDADQTICYNDLVTFTGNGASTYTFDVNGTVVQSGATNTYSNTTLENGDVVNIIGYNGNCASSVDSYTFTVNEMALTLTASPSNMICEGTAVTVSAAGGDQYEFFVNGISQGVMSATSSFSSSTLADGDEVTMTAVSASTGCTQMYGNYILMDVMPTPVITADGGPDFCEGDSVILYANTNQGIQWLVDGNPIAGATDTSLVVFDSGIYSLEVSEGGLGDLWSFGLNAQGIFADGSNLNSTEPVSAIGGVQFDVVSSGQGFMLGLTPTGSVYAWGENSSGQVGNGTFTSANSPISLPSLTGITAIATTASSAMAVNSAGGVYVWGNNSVGQLATGNTSVINFPYLNPALTNVDTVAAGRSHVVLLKNDGTVWTSGNNAYGQLGNGTLNNSLSAIQVPGLTGITSIGAGEYSSFAMNAAGDLYVWGNNGSGQLGLGDLVNRLSPTLSGLRNIVHAEGGAAHSVFLASDNDLYLSGDNTYGQLGDGSTNSSESPVQLDLEGISQVSASEYNTLILRNDRSVFAFGSNIENQISSALVTSYTTPTNISSVHGVGFVEASSTASHFIYKEENSCASVSITLNELAVPAVTITENIGVLTTVSGVSYQWFFNGSVVFEGTSQSFTPLENGWYSVQVTFANGCTGMSEEYP
ncbi:MAG: hypothetical protein EP305_07270, partial [Bacteroidetes bacterium]